jgi:xylulokinase
MKYSLGIDIGTTNVKGTLLSDDHTVVAEASKAHNLNMLGNGGVEQNPEDWWNGVHYILQAFQHEGIDLKEIEVVGVSGHGCSLAAVDKAGDPIRPALSSLDVRSANHNRWMEENATDVILEANGNRPGTYNIESKLLWYKETEPRNYLNTYKIVTATAFIVSRLTGKFVMNLSDGGILFSYDAYQRNWSDNVIDRLGVKRELFPDLLTCQTIVGGVTSQRASETGLRSGIPVIAGGEDTSSAGLATGTVRPNQAFVSLGSQGTIEVCIDNPIKEPRLLSFPHVLEGMTLLGGSMSTAGIGLEWCLREFCPDLIERSQRTGENPFTLMEKEASNIPPGADNLIFLPYMSGELHPILDSDARGVFIGLTLNHTRAHMIRSIMEASSFAIKHNLSIVLEHIEQVDEIRLTGGPSKSQIWAQSIANMTGTPVKVISAIGSDGGAPLGTAILAGTAIGLLNLEEALNSLLQIEREYHPEKEVVNHYNKLFPIYLETYTNLKGTFKKLASIEVPKSGCLAP